MKLVILGATGGTGLEIVRQAIERGHSVTALVRSPERLKPFRDRIKIERGDFLRHFAAIGNVGGFRNVRRAAREDSNLRQ